MNRKGIFHLAGCSFVLLFLWSFTMQDKPVKNSAKEVPPKTKAELGKLLFFDPILSKNKTVSCASCHKPEFAFADNVPLSFGIDSNLTTRNTPSVMNSKSRIHYFWDGRAASLEEQALKPIENVREMGLPIPEAVQRLSEDKAYSAYFKKIFKSKVTEHVLAEAIAEYERTLESATSPYDRYLNGEEEAISASAKRGRLLFIGKANCANCHTGDDFTADRLKNIGLFNAKEYNDAGRFGITKDSAHLGLFKVPGLRNIALTAPYMHNGLFNTLREVIEYYNEPDRKVSNSINRDLSLDKPLQLNEQEISDLEEFLKTLTDDQVALNK